MKKKFNKKLLTFGILGIFAIALVTAGVCYVSYRVNVNVNQPISIIGDGEHVIDCDAGETCVDISVLTISNSDEEEDKVVELTATDSHSDITTGFVGEVLLSGKDDDASWIETEPKATVYYTMIGDKFVYKVDSNDLEGDYVLVYYPDVDSAKTWNIGNAELIGDVASEWVVLDRSSLPIVGDYNINPEPDYCDWSNVYDDYLHCSGAKFWIMPESDWNAQSWNPDAWLFETDLITYTDDTSGVVSVLVPANGYVNAYLQITVDKYALKGNYPVDITVA